MDSTTLISTRTATELTTSEAAFAGGFLGTMLIAVLILTVLVIIGEWKIFEKAGEKGWKSLIPIYGQYILFKIAGIKNWFWALFCVTIVGSIMMSVNQLPVDFNAAQDVINAQLNAINWSDYAVYLLGATATGIASFAAMIALSINLAKAFGKGLSYILGLIFIPEIVLMVLGFGKAKYDKKVQKD